LRYTLSARTHWTQMKTMTARIVTRQMSAPMASARAPFSLRFQPEAAMPTQTAVIERIESAITCESEPHMFMAEAFFSATSVPVTAALRTLDNRGCSVAGLPTSVSGAPGAPPSMPQAAGAPLALMPMSSGLPQIEKAYMASRSPRSVLERFDSASFADTEEDGLSTPTPQATPRDLARRIAIIDTVLDLRNYEQHLLMEYFSSLLCTTPTEEHEERDDKIVRVDLTARTDYAPYNETDAVDEEVAVTASSRAPPLAGPHYTHANPGARPLIRRPHLDGEQTYDDPESAALIARARALLPPPEDEGPEDPNDAILRKARRMCGKPEEEGAPAPEAAVEEFDPLLARAKALSIHASRVAAELESQIAAIGKSAPVEAPAPAIVISKEEQDLVARARALIADTEPAPPPMAPSSGAVPAAPSSGDPEELMARIARLAQAEVEPPMTFEPLNTNVEARVEAPPVDDDLIRRARALRGVSKVARTTSK